MSRSYKKNPVCKVLMKDRKKFANRRIRRSCDDMPNGGTYKKYYPQWQICDQWYRHTWDEEIKKYESDLQTYINGGTARYCRTPMDPREDAGYYSYEDWYRIYRMK